MARTPSLSSSVRSLRSIAMTPSTHPVAGDLGRPGVDRPVEVIRQGEHLGDQALGGEAKHRITLLGRAAPEVLEFGPLALKAGQVFVRQPASFVELAVEVLEIGRRGSR